jgi:maltose alpha-D-glucosyltransferase/alpha-amylase
VEYVSDENTYTIALLQGYVPNQGDGWSYTLAYLERFLEAPPSEAPHGGFLSVMQTLAVRTAELHKAFAIRSGDPAFEPEPLTPADVDAWKAKVREEAAQTFSLLERVEKARELLARRAEVLSLIDACGAPKGAALKTRHHGDYHLGQVLIANNDFVIIDFEGEPSRPLAETRRKHSPLRDVAGMLRSFSYAKWTARERAEAKDSAGLDAWEAQVRQAFLKAYAETTGLSLEDAGGLIRLAELEKVLYELRYEVNNRPAWVHVPLSGLLGLVSGEKAGGQEP